jgi:tetratricopeptide (TPR) repeat protein
MTPGSRLTIARELGLAALLLAALPGCLQSALVCPAEGGAPWTELTSTHFVVKTNVTPAEAQAMAQDFEGSRSALERAMGWREPPSTERVEVVAFANANQFHSLDASDDSRSAYFSTYRALDIEPVPVLVMYRGDDEDESGHTTFLHELTHRFLHERYREIPVWLNEGLAQYYETFRFDGRRGFVGAPKRRSSAAVLWTDWYMTERGNLIPTNTIPSAATIASSTYKEFYGEGLTSVEKSHWMAAYYAGAFRFVHLLMNGPNRDYGARFGAYLGGLERGEKPSAALAAAFTGVDVEALEQAYRAYVSNPDLHQREIDLGPPEAPSPLAARVMSDSEIHLLWARLLPSNDESSYFVEREIGKAVKGDPSSTEARFRRALWLVKKHRPAEAEADLAAVLAARPDDPRYLLGRLDTYQEYNSSAYQCGEASAAVEATVAHLARVAASGAELNRVASYLETHGRPDAGLPFAMEAIRRAPLSPEAQDTYSMLLLQKGNLLEALTANQRATALLPERSKNRSPILHRRMIDAASAVAAPEPATTGYLAPALIQAVTAGAMPRLQCCYELGRQADRSLTVRVSVKGTIAIDGSVGEVQIVSSSMHIVAVERCVLREMAKLRFPAPTGGVATFLTPLAFSGPEPKKLPR